MKSFLRILQLGALLLALPLFGQQAPNSAIGFQPGKSFQMGDFDTVNLFNGNLTVAIPLGPSFTPGGNLAYGFHLVYNGNAWVIHDDTPPEAIPNRFSNAALGWRVSLGELVAPQDPAILDIAEGPGNWIFLGADGADHTFSLTLHDEESGTNYAGSDSLTFGTVVGYTRDGSYLRLVRGARVIVAPTHPCPLGLCIDYTVDYSIEAPDGNVHTFQAGITKYYLGGPPTVQEDAKLSYHLMSSVDRFGNYLHVTYPDPLTWVIKDGTPSGGDIRTHTVHLRNDTFYEFRGQPTAHLFVDRIDLAAFNGQTASYTFNYSDYVEISKNCDDQYPGNTTQTRFLNSITQPDGSLFAMNYRTIEHDPVTNAIQCSRTAGHLLQFTLPTGGKISYDLEQRIFPKFRDDPDPQKGPGGGVRDHSMGVKTRTLFDANNAFVGAWSYHADLTDPIDYLYPGNIVSREPLGLVVTVNDPLGQTTAYYFDVDHFGPDPVNFCYPGGKEDIEYAMPFTRMAGTATPDNLLLSSEVYDGTCTMQIPAIATGCARTCLVPGTTTALPPKRSTYVLYEQDPGSTVPTDQDRRVKQRRTVFNDDTGCGGAPCYEETILSDFDGLGHYRTETHRSNFPNTPPRVTTSHYNAVGGTYVPGTGLQPATYMILPTSLWLPGVYDVQTTSENSQTARTEFCFDATTAFLKGRRTQRSADRSRDLLATFEQTDGNVTAESYFGGDTHPLSGTTCTGDPGTPTYQLTHHYTYGSVDRTQYGGVPFKSLDLTIDKSSGLASASRDTSGLLETTYIYDTMQRLTEVRPPGEAWTRYTYTFSTPSSLSIIRRPFGSSAAATAETSTYLYFDSFGRSILSKEQFPEGWSTTKTTYDFLGRVITTSMPEFRNDSSWENFTPAHGTTTAYDRFDRPLSIQTPDLRPTTFAYTGNRITYRSACVSSNDRPQPPDGQPQPQCPGEQPFTTKETVDGYGRLSSVTEPLTPSLTTSYGYDVGNRLTSVAMDAPEGQQQRTFTYDLAGLLTSEVHPEKGRNGYGTVSYPEYDARGHLRHRIDGTTGGAFDVTFLYDAAERLTNVQDLDPANIRRDLKFFEYGIDNPSNNPRLGKLQTATRHNYQPSLGGDITVAETYTYGGPNGRVSVRDTTIGGALAPNTFSLAQSWDDLGNVAAVTYPSNAAFATPSRTVSYSYANALMTGVTGYTNGMTHLANGLLSHLGHANGENEDWMPDPNGMARPASIQITSSAGANKVIGPYTYDGTGNIEQIGDTATHTIYHYDGAGRLENTVAFVPSSPTHSLQFTYDSFGNKISEQTHRTDPNGDGIMNSSDIFYLVNFLFLHGPQPRGEDGYLSGDANNDGTVTSSDIFFLVNYLFLGGPAPSIPIEALPGGGESVPTPGNEPDSITVGTVTAAGNTVDVPVYIRDVPGTLLDRDLPHGSKIQSFGIKVAYSPASSVSSVTFTRSGITANLLPTVEFNPSTANTISLIDTFPESSNLIPLASKAPAPGNLVAHLVFTLSGSASPGSSIAITLDPSVTLLSDEGGNTSESPANGTLVLVDGAINIPSQMGTAPIASIASAPPEAVERSRKAFQSPRPARFLNNPSLAASRTLLSPRTSTYTTTTNHDAAFAYDEAGDVLHDVLHDGTGRSFTYDALSMTTGATAPLSPSGTRNFAYIYTADDERIALVETLPSGATTTNWTLRGLDNHLLRTWTNSSTSGWSWREDDIWRGGALLAYESPTGVRHYGLDHLGSPAIITDALGHSIGNLAFDAFGNGGATSAGMLEYTGQERDSANVGSSPGPVILPDYLHARYYDSARGRFLSADSISGNPHRPQTWNRYVYTENNPILLTDTTGACPACIAEAFVEVAADEMAKSAIRAGLGALVIWSSSEDIPKADPDGKPTGDESPPLLGSSGTKVDSKTLWPPKDRQNEDGTRVDVENHPESKRPGQVQIQRGEGKTKETYTVQRAFDPNTGRWGYRIANKSGAPAPGWVKQLLKDAEVRDAILKGMQKFLNEPDFNFARIYKW